MRGDVINGFSTYTVIKYIESFIELDTSGFIEIIMENKNVKKWVEIIYTPSRAVKPGGEIWNTLKRKINKYKNISFTFSTVSSKYTVIPTLSENFKEHISKNNFQKARNINKDIRINSSKQYNIEDGYGAIYINRKRIWESINTIVKQQNSTKNE